MNGRTNTNLGDSRGIGRRDFLKRVGGGVAAIGAAGLVRGAWAAETPSRPNILLIVTDQQHMGTVLEDGRRYAQTPAMDWLRARGMRFLQSFSANPVCSPARSAIFTGRPTAETGVCTNGKHIRDGMPNLGEWFSQNSDYETVYSGKWHLPSTHPREIEGFTLLPTGLGGQGNLGDNCTSRACEAFLRNRDSRRPFLLVASFMQPHDICEWLRINRENPSALRYKELADELPPLPANFEYDAREPEYLKETRAKNEPAKGEWGGEHWRYYLWSYYRHVEMVDGEIGRLLKALRETGVDRDTLIILTADHGEGLGRHQTVRKSLPYDEAIKVPLLVSWPGRIPEDAENARSLVTGMDVLPTLCDFAGFAPPPNVRGQSLRPLLEKTRAPWRDHIVVEVPGSRGRVVRTAQYKYVIYQDDPCDMLFDVIADPGETKNLASDPNHAAAVKEHRRLLREWENALDVAPNVAEDAAWTRSV